MELEELSLYLSILMSFIIIVFCGTGSYVIISSATWNTKKIILCTTIGIILGIILSVISSMWLVAII